MALACLKRPDALLFGWWTELYEMFVQHLSRPVNASLELLKADRRPARILRLKE